METFSKKVLNRIGAPACLDQLAEEAAELAQAALKLSRIERGMNPTPITKEDAISRLLEEVADVKVCLRALSDYAPVNGAIVETLMRGKADRWLERLGEAPRV